MTRDRSGNSRIVFGLAVVAVGVLLTLDNLGLFDFGKIWDYWPVILILIGISKLVSGRLGPGLVLLVIGTAFLLPLIFEDIDWHDVWDYWPLFLVGLGVHLVLRSFFPHPRRAETEGRREEFPEEPDQDLRASAFLTGVHRRVSGVLHGGSLTAVMGGCEADLRDAETPPEGAVIDIFAFWGGVTLRIPDDWEVNPQVAVLMGVLEDNTRQRSTTTGRLQVKGMALMGGLEIKN